MIHLSNIFSNMKLGSVSPRAHLNGVFFSLGRPGKLNFKVSASWSQSNKTIHLQSISVYRNNKTPVQFTAKTLAQVHGSGCVLMLHHSHAQLEQAPATYTEARFTRSLLTFSHKEVLLLLFCLLTSCVQKWVCVVLCRWTSAAGDSLAPTFEQISNRFITYSGKDCQSWKKM